MTNPSNHEHNAQTQTVYDIAEDNYILGLISKMSPIFKSLYFSSMSIKYGNLQPANEAVYSFAHKKESSRKCKTNADKADVLLNDDLVEHEHLNTNPQT